MDGVGFGKDIDGVMLVNITPFSLSSEVTSSSSSASSPSCASGQQKLLLDLGCGSGLSGRMLGAMGHHWVGLDISQHMLRIAQREGSGRSDDHGEDDGQEEEEYDSEMDDDMSDDMSEEEDAMDYDDSDDMEEDSMSEEEDSNGHSVQKERKTDRFGNDILTEDELDEEPQEQQNDTDSHDHSHGSLSDSSSSSSSSDNTPSRAVHQLFQADLGAGLFFRPGVFDGAISISVLQWLLTAPSSGPLGNPKRRLECFFASLYACLCSGARAVFQYYPEHVSQSELVMAAARRAGFSVWPLEEGQGRKRKQYLVLVVVAVVVSIVAGEDNWTFFCSCCCC